MHVSIDNSCQALGSQDAAWRPPCKHVGSETHTQQQQECTTVVNGVPTAQHVGLLDNAW